LKYSTDLLYFADSRLLIVSTFCVSSVVCRVCQPTHQKFYPPISYYPVLIVIQLTPTSKAFVLANIN